MWWCWPTRAPRSTAKPAPLNTSDTDSRPRPYKWQQRAPVTALVCIAISAYERIQMELDEESQVHGTAKRVYTTSHARGSSTCFQTAFVPRPVKFWMCIFPTATRV